MFLAVLSLCCCRGFSLVAVSGGYSLAAACRRLIPVASPAAAHGLYDAWASIVAACGLSSCGSRALAHRLGSCGAWA